MRSITFQNIITKQCRSYNANDIETSNDFIVYLASENKVPIYSILLQTSFSLSSITCMYLNLNDILKLGATNYEYELKIEKNKNLVYELIFKIGNITFKTSSIDLIKVFNIYLKNVFHSTINTEYVKIENIYETETKRKGNERPEVLKKLNNLRKQQLQQVYENNFTGALGTIIQTNIDGFVNEKLNKNPQYIRSSEVTEGADKKIQDDLNTFDKGYMDPRSFVEFNDEWKYEISVAIKKYNEIKIRNDKLNSIPIIEPIKIQQQQREAENEIGGNVVYEFQSPPMDFFKGLDVFNNIKCNEKIPFIYINTPNNQVIRKIVDDPESFVFFNYEEEVKGKVALRREKYITSKNLNPILGIIYVYKQRHIIKIKINYETSSFIISTSDTKIINEVSEYVYTDIFGVNSTDFTKTISKISQIYQYNISEFNENIFYFLLVNNQTFTSFCYIDESDGLFIEKTQKIMYFFPKDFETRSKNKCKLLTLETTFPQFEITSINELELKRYIQMLNYMVGIYSHLYDRIQNFLIKLNMNPQINYKRHSDNLNLHEEQMMGDEQYEYDNDDDDDDDIESALSQPKQNRIMEESLQPQPQPQPPMNQRPNQNKKALTTEMNYPPQQKRKVLYKNLYGDVFEKGNCPHNPLVVTDKNRHMIPDKYTINIIKYKNLELVCDYPDRPYVGLRTKINEKTGKTFTFPCCYADIKKSIKETTQQSTRRRNINERVGGEGGDDGGQDSENEIEEEEEEEENAGGGGGGRRIKVLIENPGKLEIVSNKLGVNIGLLFGNEARKVVMPYGYFSCIQACMYCLNIENFKNILSQPNKEKKVIEINKATTSVLNKIIEKGLWMTAAQQFPFRSQEYIKTDFTFLQKWKDPLKYICMLQEYFQVNIFILYVNNGLKYKGEYGINNDGDLMLPPYHPNQILTTFNFHYPKSIVLLMNYGPRSYVYEYPHVEPIIPYISTSLIQPDTVWDTVSSPLIQKLIFIYHQKTLFTIHNNIIPTNVIDIRTLLKNSKIITQQYLNPFGQCRVLWINNRHRVYINACPPLNVSVININSSDTNTNIPFTSFKDFIQNFQKGPYRITNITVYNKKEDETFYNVDVSFYIPPTTTVNKYHNTGYSLTVSINIQNINFPEQIIKGITSSFIRSELTQSPIRVGLDEEMSETFNFVDISETCKRSASVLCCWIKNLFDVYRVTNNNNNTTPSIVVSQFLAKYVKIIQTSTLQQPHTYELEYRPIFPKNLPLSDMIACFKTLQPYFPTFISLTDDDSIRFIVYNQVLFQRIEYSLKVYAINTFEIDIFQDYIYGVDDFNENEGNIITTSYKNKSNYVYDSTNNLLSFMKYINEQLSINVHKNSGWFKTLNDKIPFEFPHSIIIYNKPFILQPCENLQIALKVATVWKNNQINLGHYGISYTLRDIEVDDDIEYNVYSIINDSISVTTKNDSLIHIMELPMTLLAENTMSIKYCALLPLSI
jgi:hypothetical protein